jgi:hypothetical protein
MVIPFVWDISASFGVAAMPGSVTFAMFLTAFFILVNAAFSGLSVSIGFITADMLGSLLRGVDVIAGKAS